MTPSAARAALRTQLAQHGEDILIRRYYGPAGPNRPKYECQIRARARGAGNPALIGAVVQGKFNVIAIVDPAAAVPSGLVALSTLLPLLITDKVVIQGAELAIEALDDKTGRLGGELFRIDLQVKG